MREPELNLNECFYIIMYYWITSQEIIEKIKNTLNNKELIAVSSFIEWVRKRHIDCDDQNLFDTINFFNEDLLTLSQEILAKKREKYLTVIMNLVWKTYRSCFDLNLYGRVVNYVDWDINFSNKNNTDLSWINNIKISKKSI